MATISKPNTFSAGAVIVAAEHNDNFDTIYNDYNGNITNANIASGAAIVDTKLASITTAAKVNLSALVITSQAAGDLIYASSATVLTRLAAGSSGQRLQSAGTAAPIWAAAAENGYVVQVVNFQTGAVSTGTTVIPDDDSIPLITEGDQYMSLAITPTASSNKLKIEVVAYLATGSTSKGPLIAALFQGATTGALAVGTHEETNENDSVRPIVFNHFMTAATTSSTTFTVRGGFPGAGTTTFNGDAGARKMGGAMASSITITEIKSA